MALAAPQAIHERHRVDDFDSGVPILDEWLRRRARANQAAGASRTYVVCDDDRVVGYYALASGAVDVQLATGRVRRNMPDPVPIAVLGRLAVERSSQGRGLGRALGRGEVRPAGCRYHRHSRHNRSRAVSGGEVVLSRRRLRAFAVASDDAHGDARRRASRPAVTGRDAGR
jgi:hypothetical protein